MQRSCHPSTCGPVRGGTKRITKCTEGSASRYERGAITRGLDFDAEAVAPTIVVMLTFSDNQVTGCGLIGVVDLANQARNGIK